MKKSIQTFAPITEYKLLTCKTLTPNNQKVKGKTDGY